MNENINHKLVVAGDIHLQPKSPKYDNAIDRFSENIAEMKRDADDFGFDTVEINTCKYKLIDILPWKDGNVSCQVGEY